MQLRHYILFPLALLYSLGMFFRNLLFDLKLLPSVHFSKAVISVGNLSMGGTGKTPHVEYLIRLLSSGFKVATLSRGYGRGSKGFILGSKTSDVRQVGDEPMQFIGKFDNILVAVDENRRRGIGSLISGFPDLDVILLDDAFQHRYVRPGLSILLTPYSMPYSEDHVVPSGRLRESRSGARRADIIIVTKTPKIFSPISRRRITEELRVLPRQQIFFSYISYGEPVPLAGSGETSFPARLVSVLLLTGIADHSLLKEQVQRICSEVEVMKYEDHHRFNEKDVSRIEQRFNSIPTLKKVIITTEKDAMRLKTNELFPLIEHLPVFYIPIRIEFHGKDREEFDQRVLGFATKYKTASKIS